MSIPPLFDLSATIAVVSGAASGMGKASSLALAAHGATVVLLDRHEAGLAATAGAITAAGGRAVPRVHDVADVEAARRLFEWLDDEFGRVDFLANVAGEGLLADPLSITDADLRTVLETLVVARYAHCREAGRRMLRRGSGSIVNIGSLASLTALGRGHAAYSMAMGAVAQMTRELSTEWAARGVRVNAILPAQVLNPGLERRIDEDAAIREKWLSGIPRGRLGRPEDIQGLIVLLASDASSWITGALIPMDGGNLAMNAGGSIGPQFSGDQFSGDQVPGVQA
ncbi:MAG: SDR family oxidoreductase [Planctomycetes bacterium]|nr:SDR family oxidoreductase [Planctomycetota bacterium]